MKICNTSLQKAVTIELDPIKDDRGFFARSFCKRTLAQHGIVFDVVQCNVAFNKCARTLRGMHFQFPPFGEEKIISCSNGAVYDVIIDLNKNSTTFCQWFGITLSAENQTSLYVPKGFAHGYQTLTDNTSITYMVSQYYAPAYESGIRWNDRTFGIQWPFHENLIISSKDSNWGDFNQETGGILFNEDGDV